MDSILNSIKKLLGIEAEYEHFDTDIIIHINTIFLTLNQLGVGPEAGYAIRGKEEQWLAYTSDMLWVEAIKTYIYLKVRLIFDPPTNSFLIEAMNKQIAELEWRLKLQAEEVKQ